MNMHPIAVISPLILIMIVYFYIQGNVPKINSVTIRSDKLPSTAELRILQISDLHGKQFPRGCKQLLRKIEKLRPEIIVMTGDMIDVNTRKFGAVYSFIEALQQIQPHIYYVCGNHERKNPLGSAFVNGLAVKGVYILNNRNTLYKNKDISLCLCGVDDPHTKKDRLELAMKGVDDEKYILLLAHSPKIINRRGPVKADLILSGHTHGGQIRLPFIGAVISSGDGFFPKYNKGLYFLSENQLLHIDSGLGTRLIPIRAFNRSQVSILYLKGPS